MFPSTVHNYFANHHSTRYHLIHIHEIVVQKNAYSQHAVREEK